MEKSTGKQRWLDEKSAHLHAFGLVARWSRPMSGEDERNIHPELMQVSLILVA
jgi:hypothetical protein